MDDFLDSSERSLIMFDAVCGGLAECLALVHADIKQMTEHRNRLAQLEHEQIQAKLVPAQELMQQAETNKLQKQREEEEEAKQAAKDDNDEDPAAHYAGLELLDKRLAESFSEALNLKQRSSVSLNGKSQNANTLDNARQNRPSILHSLLGFKPSRSSAASRKSSSASATSHMNNQQTEPDNRMIIDDINRQTRLAMQYLKQLEAHLLKVEHLRSKYEMHLKMGLLVTHNNNNNGATAANCGSLARVSPRCDPYVIGHDGVVRVPSLGSHLSMPSLNAPMNTWSSSTSSSSRAAHKSRRRGSNAAVAAACAGAPCAPTASTLSLNAKRHGGRMNLSKLISNSLAKNCVSPVDMYAATNNGGDRLNTTSPSSSSQQQQYYGEQHAGSNINISIQNPTSPYAEFGSSNPMLDASAYGQVQYCEMAGASSLKRRRARKSSSHGQQIHATQTSLKELSDNLRNIESEFESYMGSFLLVIEEIQGFARVCQGDTFEISLRYGQESPKFKTRIQVLKDNRQKCDKRQTVFKARIAERLAIKAYERKGFGSRVVLGNKLCDTSMLFSARSQLMTISLNQTGSIKLNMTVTWNPLHMAPNATSSLLAASAIATGGSLTADVVSHISLPPTPISSSTLSSLSSGGPSINGSTGCGSGTNAPAAMKHHHHHQQQQQQHQPAITTTINIQSQRRSKATSSRARDQHEHEPNYYHHHGEQHTNTRSHAKVLLNNNNNNNIGNSTFHKSLVANADVVGGAAANELPVYGYYIPPPDYQTCELNCQE